jgi:FkbM family methyltransferase
VIPPASTRLGRLIRAPLRLVPPNRVVRILSGPLAGRRWVTGSAPHGCWLGTYERDLQQAMAATIRPGDVVYDIGATVGFFTLLAATLTGPRGCVVAIEPLPRNVELLERHLALNGIGHVRVVAAAVSNEPGTARFAQDESPSMGHLSPHGSRSVPLVTIDGLVAEGRPAPHVIKMDIEGAEALALAGATQTLRVHRPVLFLSTHGFAAHEACCSALRGMGYRLALRRDGAADGQYEVVASPGVSSP